MDVKSELDIELVIRLYYRAVCLYIGCIFFKA